jgi:hypothetical protein
MLVRSAVQLLRNPVWAVVGLSTPILYLALFTPLLKHLSTAPGLRAPNVLDVRLATSSPAWASWSRHPASGHRASPERDALERVI